MDEEMKKRTRQNFKENYIKRLKASLISLVVAIVLIVFGFILLPQEAAFICAGVVFVCWFIFLIVYSIVNGKKANKLNKQMEEKYMNGEITKEEYGEFVKEESKAKNIAYIVIVIVLAIRILVRFMR